MCLFSVACAYTDVQPCVVHARVGPAHGQYGAPARKLYLALTSRVTLLHCHTRLHRCTATQCACLCGACAQAAWHTSYRAVSGTNIVCHPFFYTNICHPVSHAVVCSHTLTQMYSHASRLPVWRLRTGRMAHLLEGCFLPPVDPQPTAPLHQSPPDSKPSPSGAFPSCSKSSAQAVQPGFPPAEHRAAHAGDQHKSTAAVTLAAEAAGSTGGSALGIGPAALAFMCRQLPLLDVPWGVKLALEAAGVSDDTEYKKNKEG